MRSQFATANFDMRRTLPYAFTEQGIAMLSGILRSKKAVQVNIESKYDAQFAEVFTALRYVLDPERK